MISYLDIVKNSAGSEEKMWQAVEHVSDFMNVAIEAHPEEVSKFLQEQYELLNGQHFNEWLAKKVVSEMWHTSADGKSKVYGELINPSEAAKMLHELTSEDQLGFRWDAYVAANTFAHDLNGTNAYTNVDLLLKLSEKFWFEDEDFEDGNKIYWYHTSKKGFWR